jgi:hypothetical protein
VFGVILILPRKMSQGVHFCKGSNLNINEVAFEGQRLIKLDSKEVCVLPSGDRGAEELQMD